MEVALVEMGLMGALLVDARFKTFRYEPAALKEMEIVGG
jgi:hypothetical protein